MKKKSVAKRLNVTQGRPSESVYRNCYMEVPNSSRVCAASRNGNRLSSTTRFIHAKVKNVYYLLSVPTNVLIHITISNYITNWRGWNSSVHIATRYRLGSPRIESPQGRNFPHPSRTALGPTQPPIEWVPGLSWG